MNPSSLGLSPDGEMCVRRQRWFVLVVVILAACAPFAVYPVFLMKGLCFALFASSFNLLLGFAGLLSFGHAMFFGWSSYVTAHALKVWGLPPEIAILAGTAVAAIMGLAIGWLAIRRQGIYFAMITLALAQFFFFLAVQIPFTRGEDGIQAVPRGHLFGLIDLNQMMPMYYFVLVVFAAGLFFLHRVVHSPYGQVLKAIRDNEPRAISLGYDIGRYKLTAFVLSATVAGLAGSLKSIVFQLASLTDVDWHMSGEVVLMTLLGGVGTLFGPTVGAFVVVTIQNYFAGIGAWVTMLQGAIFVVCVLAFRDGIVGVIAPFMKKRGIIV